MKEKSPSDDTVIVAADKRHKRDVKIRGQKLKEESGYLNSIKVSSLR